MTYVLSQIEVQEIDIKDRLNLKVLGSLTPVNPAIISEVMPDTEFDFTKAYSKPKYCVCYGKSKFEKTSSMSFVRQEEEMVFRVIIMSKLQRGENGIFDLARKAKKALIGFSPTNCNKLRALKFDLEGDGFVQNVWYYCLELTTDSLLVEDIEDNYEELSPSMLSPINNTTP